MKFLYKWNPYFCQVNEPTSQGRDENQLNNSLKKKWDSNSNDPTYICKRKPLVMIGAGNLLNPMIKLLNFLQTFKIKVWLCQRMPQMVSAVAEYLATLNWCLLLDRQALTVEWECAVTWWHSERAPSLLGQTALVVTMAAAWGRARRDFGSWSLRRRFNVLQQHPCVRC